MFRKLLTLLLAFVLTSSVVLAQRKPISGTISDNYGSPLPGVSVVLKGTSIGVSSDFDGKYSVEAPVDGILVFSMMGFTNKEIAINGNLKINVVLLEDVELLNEVVVTALGIKKEKKALGYSVQDVKGDVLTATGDGNVSTALQGKVAGVNITTTGGAGGNSRIEMRGNSSLVDDNDVLWVIDGIPFSAGESSDGDFYGGVSNGGALLDLNPNDIETMSVLKGGTAAALYGSRGANGVIVVTTKDGSKSKGLGISYSGSTTVSKAAYYLDLQNEYGQGSLNVYDKNGTSAWGPAFDNKLRESWTGQMLPYVGNSDKLKEFANSGIATRHALAFTNGSDKGNYRVSLAKDKTEGIFEGHEINKINFDVKAAYNINKWLKIDTKVSYVNTKGQQRPEIGSYSVMSYFNSMPANIRLQDLAPGYDIKVNKHIEKLYTTANANYRNPYFLQEQTVNDDERNRSFGYLAANIKFTDFLKLKVKYGLDTYRYETTNGYLYGDNVDANRPIYNTSEKNYTEDNTEFLLSFNKDLSEDFVLGASVGGNKMHREWDRLEIVSGKLNAEGNYFLSAAEDASSIKTTETFLEEEIQSLYGFIDLSYKNYLFLNATARNDWSSTLPINNNSYFYPSASLSAVISEMAEFPDWISYLKVRGSWAQVGKDSDPYLTNQVYTLEQWNFNLTKSEEPNTLVNIDLEPEISTSTEVGFETRLFKSRVGFDLTYYVEDTKNQIVEVALDQATGYENRLTNLGLVSNKGIEIMANFIPVRTNDFEVGVTLNFAKNIGKVKELETAEDNDEFYTFTDFNSVEIRATEGEKMGDIYGHAYERNNNGTIVVGDDGLPKKANERQVLGNIQPDFTGSIGLNATYKNFTFDMLLGMQQGGDIYSLTEKNAVASGTAARTVKDGRAPFVFDGVTESGASNAKTITAQEYWQSVSGITEEFIYDASYMKLREISLGYNLPQEFLNKIPGKVLSSVKVSLFGRDLFYLYKDTPGTVPDASSYSSSYGAKAFDFSPVPVTKSYGISLNVKF